MTIKMQNEVKKSRFSNRKQNSFFYFNLYQKKLKFYDNNKSLQDKKFMIFIHLYDKSSFKRKHQNLVKLQLCDKNLVFK